MANPPKPPRHYHWLLQVLMNKLIYLFSAQVRVYLQIALIFGFFVIIFPYHFLSLLEPEFYFVIKPFEVYDVVYIRIIGVVPAVLLVVMGVFGYCCCYGVKVPAIRKMCLKTGVVFAIIAVILIIALPKDLFRKADVNVVRNRLLETTNDTRFDDIWITVQNKFECCGVDRGIDWVGSSRFETEPDNAPTCCRNTDECADIKTVEQFDRCCPTAGCLPHILKSFYEYQELWHTRMFTFYHYMILLLGVVLANAILPKRYWYDCDQVARLPNPNQDDEIPLLDLSAHENDQPDAADDATSQQL